MGLEEGAGTWDGKKRCGGCNWQIEGQGQRPGDGEALGPTGQGEAVYPAGELEARWGGVGMSMVGWAGQEHGEPRTSPGGSDLSVLGTREPGRLFSGVGSAQTRAFEGSS